MKVSQLTPVPEGLRAVYVGVLQEPDGGTKTVLADRLVDCIAVVDHEAADIKAQGTEGRKGASRGQRSDIVGVMLEGTAKAQFAPDATEWLGQMYGDKLIGARFLGYARNLSIDEIMQAVNSGDAEASTPEMLAMRTYWSRAARQAVNRILGRGDAH